VLGRALLLDRIRREFLRGAQNTPKALHLQRTIASLPPSGTILCLRFCGDSGYWGTVKISTSLKRLLRKGILAFLRLVVGRSGGTPPDPTSIKRILLLRYDRIGDAVITTPLIEALHRIAPTAEIDILASPANAAVFADDPRVHRVIVWPKSLAGRRRAILEGRRRDYDLVFQLILGRTTLPSILASILAPSGCTIGNSVRDHEFLFDRVVDIPHGHFADRTLALVAGALPAPDTGPKDLPYSLAIGPVSAAEGDRLLAEQGLVPGSFILINISAGTADRELSLEQNVALASRLCELYGSVAITGSPSAKREVERIAELSGAKPLLSSSILVAALFCKRARVVVTPDTATLHIASAVGVPVVAYFKAGGDPFGWGPRGVPSVVIERSRQGDGTTGVGVEDLVDGVMRLINNY
jgi:ADP-heptose:LPS heptosyltransferase